MEIGVVNILRNNGNCFEHVSQFGLNVCQLIGTHPELCTGEITDNVLRESAKHGVRICAMWGWVAGPGA